MYLSLNPRSAFPCTLFLLALILAWAPGRANAADSFSGDFGGVCFGITDNTGSDLHYCYYAKYDIDGAGQLIGAGMKSTQGLASPPHMFSVSSKYQLFRREGVLMGLAGLAKNRTHGRLSDDLEYGLFMPLHDDDDWYLIMIAPSYSGVDIGVDYLNSDYWFVQYQLWDDGSGGESHVSTYGSETYDGLGGISYDFNTNTQGYGIGYGSGTMFYEVSGQGVFARASEEGYVLDNGLLLAASRVDNENRLGITLSVRKAAGTLSQADLQGPYWMARYQYNNAGGADQHAITLGEVYFDGAGGADFQITTNVKGYGLFSGLYSDTYTVASDGAFSMGGFDGGVGIYNRVILAAQANTEDKWGIMVLVKRTGVEDPSPLCKMLGLMP